MSKRPTVESFLRVRGEIFRGPRDRLREDERMQRLVPIVFVGLVVAACGDSTDSTGQAPGGGAGSNSEEVIPDSGPVDSVVTSDVDPVATDPEVSSPPVTEPAVTEPSVTEPATTEPVATDPPVTDPPGLPTPTDRVVRFFAGSATPGIPWAPLGYWDGASWQEADYLDDGTPTGPASPITNVAASTLDLPDGPEAVIDGLTLGLEEPFCVGNEVGPFIDLPVEVPATSVSLGYDVIAVTADWPLQPRPVRQAGLQVPIYSEIGGSFLLSEVDTAFDGTVVQAVRVDLDGNDVDEVLVTYERQEAGDFGGVGDFSSIYVRYPSSDGTVIDEVLVSYVSADPVDFPTPGRYSLAAVADLNGDGVMEVMIRDQFWESGGMQVLALVDGRLTRVGGGGCGL